MSGSEGIDECWVRLAILVHETFTDALKPVLVKEISWNFPDLKEKPINEMLQDALRYALEQELVKSITKKYPCLNGEPYDIMLHHALSDLLLEKLMERLKAMKDGNQNPENEELQLEDDDFDDALREAISLKLKEALGKAIDKTMKNAKDKKKILVFEEKLQHALSKYLDEKLSKLKKEPVDISLQHAVSEQLGLDLLLTHEEREKVFPPDNSPAHFSTFGVVLVEKLIKIFYGNNYKVLDLEHEELLTVYRSDGRPALYNKLDFELRVKLNYIFNNQIMGLTRQEWQNHVKRQVNLHRHLSGVEILGLESYELQKVYPVDGSSPEYGKFDVGIIFRLIKHFAVNKIWEEEMKNSPDIERATEKSISNAKGFAAVDLVRKYRNWVFHRSNEPELVHKDFNKHWEFIMILFGSLEYKVGPAERWKSCKIDYQAISVKETLRELAINAMEKIKSECASKVDLAASVENIKVSMSNQEEDLQKLIQDVLSAYEARLKSVEGNMAAFDKDVGVIKDLLTAATENVQNLTDWMGKLQAGPQELDLEELRNQLKEHGLRWVNEQFLPDLDLGPQRKIEKDVRVDPELVDSSEGNGAIESEFANLRQRSIKYEDVLSKDDRVTFVRSVGGGGKTTLALTLYHLWCSNEIGRDFDFVFSLRARELNALDFSCSVYPSVPKRNLSEVDFVLGSDPAMQNISKEKQVSWEELRSSKMQVLFILDGLDEIIVQEELAATIDTSVVSNKPLLAKALGKILKEIACKQNFCIIFLGRHEACNKLSNAFRSAGKKTRVIEMAGFSREKIDEYIAKYARLKSRDDILERLVRHIQDFRPLISLLRIPFYLWVFCCAYSDSDFIDTPKTQTELLVVFILMFIRFHARGDDERSLRQSELFELLDDYKVSQIVCMMCKVAYDHLLKGEFIFTIKSKPPWASEGKGLLVVYKYSRGYRCQFQHNIIHEFLAAAYMFAVGCGVDYSNFSFLTPCCLYLCGFLGARDEGSSRPWLLTEFVNNVLRPLHRDRTSGLLRVLYEWAFTPLEGVCDAITCDDHTPVEVTWLLNNCLREGIVGVKELHRLLGTQQDEDDAKEWFEGLSFVPAKSRDVQGVRVQFGKDFNLSLEIRDTVKYLLLHFTRCEFGNLNLHYHKCVLELLKSCSTWEANKPVSMKHLRFEGCAEYIEDPVHVKILTPLASSLHSIFLMHVKLTPENLDGLLKRMCSEETKPPVEVAFVNCALRDTHLLTIIPYISGLSTGDHSMQHRIEYLNISNRRHSLTKWKNSYTRDGIDRLRAAILTRTCAFRLDLSSCDLDDLDFRMLLPALSRMENCAIRYNLVTRGIYLEAYNALKDQGSTLYPFNYVGIGLLLIHKLSENGSTLLEDPESTLAHVNNNGGWRSDTSKTEAGEASTVPCYYHPMSTFIFATDQIIGDTMSTHSCDLYSANPVYGHKRFPTCY